MQACLMFIYKRNQIITTAVTVCYEIGKCSVGHVHCYILLKIIKGTLYIITIDLHVKAIPL